MGGYWSKSIKFEDLWTNLEIQGRKVYTIYDSNMDNLLYDNSTIYLFRHNETDDLAILLRGRENYLVVLYDINTLRVFRCDSFITDVMEMINRDKCSFTIKSGWFDTCKLTHEGFYNINTWGK